MRPIKLIAAVAAVSCTLAVSSARAQSITNTATFTAVAYEPGTTTTNNDGTITYTMNKVMYNTAALLAEINSAITTNKFSKAAKLVLIVTDDNLSTPSYAVVDGTNFYNLSSIIEPGAGVAIKSGTEGDAIPERKLTEVDRFQINYDDTAHFTNANQGLEFTLDGFGTFTRSDTATNRAGDYSETYKASVTSLTGEGHAGTNYFFMTGMLSVSGNAKQ